MSPSIQAGLDLKSYPKMRRRHEKLRQRFSSLRPSLPDCPRGVPAPNSTGMRITPANSMRIAWITLAILSGLNLLNYLDRYVMSGALVPLQKDLHLGDADAGWAVSAFMLGYFISAPLFGYLGDRWPRKYLMLAGVIVWSAATAGSGLAHTFTQLFLIRIFVGFGEACFVTMGPSWISDLFPASRLNTAITLFYVAIPFGSALGFTLGGYFSEHGDWRAAFLYAGLPGILLALALLFLREPQRGESSHETPRKPAGRAELWQLLRNARYQLLVWGYAAQTFSIGAFGVWGPAFLHRVHQFPIARAASLFGGLLALCGLVATLLGGMAGTYLRRTVAGGYVWMMAVSMILALPVCWFALTTSGAVASLAGLGASMFLLFLPTGPITSELLEIAPVALRSTAMALSVFVIHLFGDWGSPTIVGYLSDWAGHREGAQWVGDLQKGVLILPVVLGIGAVLWCVLLYLSRKVEPSYS